MLFFKGVFIPEMPLGEFALATKHYFYFRFCARFLVDFISFNFRCSFFSICLKYSCPDSSFYFFPFL